MRIILTLALFFILSGVFLALEFGKNTKDGIIFCDVGQGDGFIVNSGRVQVIFDGGTGSKISGCFSKYIPIWDRNVEAMVLTHPQRDHMEGQLDIFKRYSVEKVIFTGVGVDGALVEQWLSLKEQEGAQTFELKRGDSFSAGDLNFEVLWPTKSFLQLWSLAPGSDLNETSYVIRLNRGNFCAYLTGDITVERLTPLIDKECQILKVGHHGSKSATNGEVILKIKPEIAVIQVGKNNSYGHPHREVIDALLKNGVKVFRNDLEGDIRLGFNPNSIYIEK